MNLLLERVEGIEPSQLAWKANVLPLNYTRGCFKRGFITIHLFPEKSSPEQEKSGKNTDMTLKRETRDFGTNGEAKPPPRL